MNYLKKQISIVLVFAMIVVLFQPITVTNALTSRGNETEELSQVLLYEDSSKMIISLVNEEQEEAYKKDILTNSIFKEDEILKANRSINHQDGATTYLPAGEIINQRSMYQREIQQTVDRVSGNGTFAKIISNPISDATIGALVKAASKSNVYAFCATALIWSVGDLMNRQQSWWNDSLIQILTKKISRVRVTHIRNTTSDYPAAYLIIERL
ncbi:MAG: hypothetical protein ACRC3Y_17245 [Romboutsia sp.]|uniref:hypothetical protein n=1 Tax=Romboutsia sp. TaxID=1965302 RepID=UPI003F2D0643